MKNKLTRQPVRSASGRSPAAAASILAVSLIALILLSSSALAYDFAGRVEKVSEPSRMWVNITQPGTYPVGAVVEVLLGKPLSGLSYFKGKDLQFESQGHDILGRPVCEAYLDGKNIREAYYCVLYPAYCDRGYDPTRTCSPEYGYYYYWPSPYERCLNDCPPPSPYGMCDNCCPDNYPWLPFF